MRSLRSGRCNYFKGLSPVFPLSMQHLIVLLFQNSVYSSPTLMAHTMSQSQSPTHILVPMIICSELLVLCITTNDGSMFEVVLLWELKITRMAHMAYWFKQSFSTLKIYLISMDIRCTNYAISFRQTTSFLIIKQEYK